MDYDILNYSHIIWDFNGTLLDDVDKSVSAVNSMLRKRSLPLITKDSYLEKFDFPVINYYKALGFDFNTVSFDHLAVEFVREFFKEGFSCPLQKGVIEALEFMKKNNMSQSVLSASHTAHLKKYLEALNINNYFILFHGQDNIKGMAKSARGLIHLRELGIDPESILYIGDTVHDFQVASSLGCDHLLVANGHNSKSRLSMATDRIIDSLDAIFPAVQYSP